MDETVLSGIRHDNEDAALMTLLETVGSVFSLTEIASAYCDAGKDADMAVEILYEKQASSSSSVSLGSASDSEVRSEKSAGLSYIPELFSTVNENLKPSKPKKYTVSAGSVAGVIGKDYLKATPQAKDSYVDKKPLRLDSTEFPVSEIWTEGDRSNSSKDDQLQKDMEEFLFKMLGDGFQLSRDMIQEVLGKCGYDMQLSMDKLFELEQSEESSYRGSKNFGKSKMFPDADPNSVEPSREMKMPILSSSRGLPQKELPRQQKGRSNLGKEVLSSLFNAPERYKQSPKRIERVDRRHEVFGQVVSEPLKERTSGHNSFSMPLLHDDVEDEDHGEGSFLALRREIKEYRGMMKEYYKAAVDAFAKGEHARARKLLEQGQFFHQKAREKDEESAQKIFETRNKEEEHEVMLVNLHEHDAREGVRLLKCHIQSLAGSGCFKYLKVVMEKDAEDIPKSTRRRRVMRFLENESIEWSEGEDAGTIMIPLEEIDRKSLRFLKKKQEEES
ncbi:hypothetical protein ACFE04_002028 [Oxalis oulophora]